MKIQTRFLLVPAVASALIAMLGGAAIWSMRIERDAIDRLNERNRSTELVQRIRTRAAETNAHAYRLLGLIGSFDDARVKDERKAVRERVDTALLLVADLEKLGGEDSAETAGALGKPLTRLKKLLDDAIDLASVDANTGLAAMQTADQEFVVLVKVADEAARLARFKSVEEYQEVLATQRRAEWIIGVAALAAAIVTLALCRMLGRSLVSSIGGAVGFAKSVAAGNLNSRIAQDGTGEVGELQRSLADMQASLREIVAKVRGSTDSIGTASAQIAAGNSDLSGRTESQASSLEQTSASMQQLTQTVRGNTESARQANQLALSASEVAQRGGTVVSQVVERMDAISATSGRIVEIIGVIDGIAFQTNILALNAAVEAARAGEQGRGFAVVASEVRNLAQRSAEAAREIKGLITASVDEVRNGSLLVKDAGETMTEIVGSVRRVTDIIGEISAATQEQSGQIEQVNAAVDQLDRMTQQNAALVEQSAAAAESLRNQARALAEAVSVFALEGGAAPTPAAPGATPAGIEAATVPARARAPARAAAPAAAPAQSEASPPGHATPASNAKTAGASPQAAPAKAATLPAKAASLPAKATPAPAKATSAPDDDWETF
ncbi:MAG: methyl-accepting chemotaxis protein [Burkholderiaceae bacterium]